MELPMAVFLYSACPLALFIFILFKYRRPALAPKLPPGPRQLPIIGNLHQLLRAPPELQLPHRLYRSLSRTYGPLMHLKLGQVSVIVASSPEAAREIMKTHDVTFATRPLFTAVKIFTYNGQSMSFTPYGEYYRQLRRICILELLSPKRIQSFRAMREEEVQNLIQSISSSPSSQHELSVVNLSKELSMLASNIMARAAVGNKCSEDQIEFVAAVHEAFDISGDFYLADIFPSWSGLLGLVSGFKSKVERCHRKLDRILDSIVQQHKIKKITSTTEEEEEVIAGSSYNGQQHKEEEDILDVLLRLKEDGGLEFELTDDCIKGIILEILGAGTDTTSTVVEWAMSELMKNPEVMQQAQSEVRKLLQGKNKVTEEDIKELNYLHLVIKETLRLHPPGPLLLPRECQETCEILGYEVPKKARVSINVWAMGRDPQYWEDAEKFNPDRFEGNHIDFKGANFEFLPFGSGRKMCPGMMFGLATVELALAQLLYYFNWELPHGIEPHNLDMTESFGVSARRNSNLCLHYHPYINPCSAVAAQGL